VADLTSETSPIEFFLKDLEWDNCTEDKKSNENVESDNALDITRKPQVQGRERKIFPVTSCGSK
jgi:hypothetical protein